MTERCTMRRDVLLQLCVAMVVVRGVGDGSIQAAERPNVVLVMADDQGWGQTGYYGHPILETPLSVVLVAEQLNPLVTQLQDLCDQRIVVVLVTVVTS